MVIMPHEVSRRIMIQLGQPEKTYDHILCLTAQQMGSSVACKVQPCLNACCGCSDHLPKGNPSFEAVIAHYEQLVQTLTSKVSLWQ